jgi:hypothetical protein
MSMTQMRDWQHNRHMWMTVLEKQTGHGLSFWIRKIQEQNFRNERQLRAWLSRQGVTGYGRQLLVMEQFGYPDFIRSTGEALIDKQYSGYPEPRAIYDAIIKAAATCGDVVIQTRKTWVSLVSPRRTFARIQRTTKTRVDLGLRLERQRPGGRLVSSKIHETMRVQVGLSAPEEVDSEVRTWLRRAYAENT